MPPKLPVAHQLGYVSPELDEGWTEPCSGPVNATVYRIDTPDQAELVKEYILSVFAQAGP